MRAERSPTPVGRRRILVGTELVTLAAAAAAFVAIVTVLGAVRGTDDVSTATLVVAAVAVAIGYDPARRRVLPVVARGLGAEDQQRSATERLVGAIARYEDPDRALHAVASTTRTTLDADAVAVRLEVDRRLVTVAADPANAALGPPQEQISQTRTTDLVVPIVDGDERVGVLEVRVDRALRASELRLLANTAAAAAIVTRTATLRRSVQHRLELALRQREELTALRTQTGRAQLAERRRLERELHDTCQQRAVVLAGKVGLLAAAGGTTDDGVATALLAEIEANIDLLEDSIERVLGGASPLTLLGSGLTGALYAEAAAVPVPTEIVDATTRRYPQAVEEHVYACCLEAIRNAVAHGEPSRIVVRLDEQDGWLRFEVDDDGSGFEDDDAGDGRGLGNMRSRVDELGGHLSVASTDRGTTVRGAVPVGGAAP